jgi:hypothetical protein
MNATAVNAELGAIEADIARLSVGLERLQDAPRSADALAERIRVIAALDCLLLAQRAAQGERLRLLIEAGFPCTLGWASRVAGCPVGARVVAVT